VLLKCAQDSHHIFLLDGRETPPSSAGLIMSFSTALNLSKNARWRCRKATAKGDQHFALREQEEQRLQSSLKGPCACRIEKAKTHARKNRCVKDQSGQLVKILC
jgi:hypothetical protein